MTKLDRYILLQFLQTLFFSIASLSVIFVVVSLLEKLDKFLDKGTPTSVIIEYYINYLPEIIKILTPMSMLLASLFTTGRMANNNEITAMKTGGMSLYRFMAPLLLFSALLSFGQLYFNGWVVPHANRVKKDIEREYLQKGPVVTALHNVYFRDTEHRNVHINYYDDNTKTGRRISIEEYSSEEQPRMTMRLDAPTFVWDTLAKVWILQDATERRFDSTITTTQYSRQDSMAAPLNITPLEMMNLQRESTELSFDELREYIELSRRGGKDVDRMLIDYYGQYALPFANFIVVLFGIPFSSGKRKAGLALEIAAAMFISFTYLAFTKIGQSVGYASGMNPIVSGWLANGIFFLVGIINIFRVRS